MIPARLAPTPELPVCPLWVIHVGLTMSVSLPHNDRAISPLAARAMFMRAASRRIGPRASHFGVTENFRVCRLTLGSGFVLDCTNKRREYGPASTTGDLLRDNAAN